MMTVAAIQMASGPRLDANLAEAARLLRIAAEAGARLAVLPEYFAQFGLPERVRTAGAESPGSGPVQDFLARHAWDVSGHLI